MTLFAFDALEDKEETVKDSLKYIADKLTKFWCEALSPQKFQIVTRRVKNRPLVVVSVLRYCKNQK